MASAGNDWLGGVQGIVAVADCGGILVKACDA
jgi:hypothetical protein